MEYKDGDKKNHFYHNRENLIKKSDHQQNQHNIRQIKPHQK